MLHLVLPPPSVLPWASTSGAAAQPAKPVVPKRLEQVVQIHWDWKATPEESVPTQFWRTMDELDILLLPDETIRESHASLTDRFLPTSPSLSELTVLCPVPRPPTADRLSPALSLSLSLSIPLLYPSSPLDSSTSFPFALAKPRALPSFSAVRLLRAGTGDGVEMGTHWNLRREVLALLERGWSWKEARKGGSRDDNWLAVVEALG